MNTISYMVLTARVVVVMFHKIVTTKGNYAGGRRGDITKMADDNNTRKPHNYWEEATPAQWEEWAKRMQREEEESAKMSVDAAEAKRIEDIGKAQWTFDKVAKTDLTIDNGNGDPREEQARLQVLEDELQNMDKDPHKEIAYKIGYDETNQVPKNLDGNTSSRHNEWYLPYSLKILAA